MKISTLQENIKQGLLVVGHIAGKNINLPILNNVMIDVLDGKIKLTTTNLEIGVVKTIRGKIEKEGSFTVDSKVFSDYISLLPNNKIEIETKDNNLVVKTDGYKTKITGQEAKDFPLIPNIEKDIFYSVSVDVLKEALSQVVFAVSNSETRVEISGVLFNFSGEKLILASTDSYRLAEKEVNIKTNSENNDAVLVIVPAKTVHELIRILSNIKNDDVDSDSQEVKIYLSENQIMFSVDSMELISRIIEGQYPDYKQIFPQKGKTDIVVSRTQLVRAIKASSLFSKTGINDVSLDFPADQNKIIVSSTSSQAGESVIEIDAKISGNDNGVIVNYRYLLDGLNNIDEENVHLTIVDSNTPCVLKPEKEKGYIYIVMPIKQ